jgi:hypothetical protein
MRQEMMKWAYSYAQFLPVQEAAEIFACALNAVAADPRPRAALVRADKKRLFVICVTSSWRRA